MRIIEYKIFHHTLTLYRRTDIIIEGDENDNTTAYEGHADVPLSFIENQ